MNDVVTNNSSHNKFTTVALSLSLDKFHKSYHGSFFGQSINTNKKLMLVLNQATFPTLSGHMTDKFRKHERLIGTITCTDSWVWRL